MRKEQIFIRIILYGFLAGAVITDLWRNKIYNLWVIPELVAGVTLCALRGPDAFKNSLLAILAAFLICLPVYMLKGIAAGDVKLIMSTASFLSLQELYSCILYSFLIAGAISLLVIIFKKNKQRTIHFALPVMMSTCLTLGGFL